VDKPTDFEPPSVGGQVADGVLPGRGELDKLSNRNGNSRRAMTPARQRAFVGLVIGGMQWRGSGSVRVVSLPCHIPWQNGEIPGHGVTPAHP